MKLASLQLSWAKRSIGRCHYPGKKGRNAGYIENSILEVFQMSPKGREAKGKVEETASIRDSVP